VIAFIAGGATVLAFAPFGLHPLALVGFGVLMHLWHAAPPSRCFRTGFWFGLGLFGAGVSWVYVSMTQFGGMPAPVGAVATAGFCAFLALFPAAAGWLQARLPAPELVRASLLIPAAWTLFEWLRGWIFTGFPWLAVGYTASGWPLAGLAPLFGVFGISFVLVSLAGLAWHLAFRKARVIALALLLILVGAAEGLRHVSWTDPVGAPVSVALLQGNIQQELKFRPERYSQILDTYARLVEETRARLIVLPETAVPRFYDRVEPGYLARLQRAARANEGDLLLGVPFRAGEDYYNSVVSLGTSPQQAYHKVHLVPFGEFIPAGFAWALRTLQIPLSDFSRGARAQPPLLVAGQRVAVNVCYEDTFGEEIAAGALQATLLVNVSNVAWFGDSFAPAQHLQIARLRALETGRMHLTATNTGITAAIDRDGRVLGRLPQFAEGRLEVVAQGYFGMTPYMRWADWPAVIGCLALLAGAALVARRRMTQ
jgi:apolipoprotein N-acyltransferase